MPIENTTTRSLTRQSQVVVTRAPSRLISGQAAGAGWPVLSARDSGSQNTDSP